MSADGPDFKEKKNVRNIKICSPVSNNNFKGNTRKQGLMAGPHFLYFVRYKSPPTQKTLLGFYIG